MGKITICVPETNGRTDGRTNSKNRAPKPQIFRRPDGRTTYHEKKGKKNSAEQERDTVALHHGPCSHTNKVGSSETAHPPVTPLRQPHFEPLSSHKGRVARMKKEKKETKKQREARKANKQIRKKKKKR